MNVSPDPSQNNVAAHRPGTDALWRLMDDIMDPEIPVLSIVDLGIVRDIEAGVPPRIMVTPTYTGCPATDMINGLIRAKTEAGGFGTPDIVTVLSPAWTTDWLSEQGRLKLMAYGIAPPVKGIASKRALMGKAASVCCPRCGSAETERVSEFGSTACKALYRCGACLEPFDYFKCV